MFIQDYANQLQTTYPSSVSRREVHASFQATRHGTQIQLMDNRYLEGFDDGYSGVPRLNQYLATQISAGSIGGVLAITAIVLTIIVVAIPVHPQIGPFSVYELATVVTLAGASLPGFAIAGVAHWHKKNYLDERLDQTRLIAYLTEIQSRADSIRTNGAVSQDKAWRAQEISRQLSAQQAS